MSTAGHEFDTPRTPSHDGALRCMVCSDSGPLADPEWCPVVERLICDSCCTSLPMGDPDFMDTIEVMTGRSVCPKMVAEECERCHRRDALEMRGLSEAIEGGAC